MCCTLKSLVRSPPAMNLDLTQGGVLFFLTLFGICRGFVQENCTSRKHKFEEVFSVPGDIAMLNSTLVSPNVFNFTSVPYIITWYDLKKGQEINNQTGRFLVQGETLWFLKVTLEDHGEYVTILRTPFGCFRQDIKLVVDKPLDGKCGRPRKNKQTIRKGVNYSLSCPLQDHIEKLESHNIIYNIMWYKVIQGCDLIKSTDGKYIIQESTTLYIENAHPDDKGTYTCALNFTLAGVTGSVSESIGVTVKESYILNPEIREPFGQIIKKPLYSNFSKQCQIFVPCECTKPSIGIAWFVRGEKISRDPSKRVYMGSKSSRKELMPRKGYFFTLSLVFRELREEDFYLNYTCEEDMNMNSGYFTLLPPDPNIILPIGLVFSAMAVLTISAVIVYHFFKIGIVLWFRKAFPALYPNKDLDGKLYDAYVAYPQPCDSGFSEDIDKFALHTLPEVLEEACGYQLFIAGRDCVPGHAIVDSVEENLQASRRVLLLYTASTFISKRQTTSASGIHNKITLESNDCSRNTEGKNSDESGNVNLDYDKEVYSDKQPKFEYAAAMHKALLEGSLKVVLVELEEISPAQLALFPESVRQLRKKQGAVCWWKTLRKSSHTCMRKREDEEKGEQDTQLSPSLSPSSRFWKEIRYHMPVKGKRRCTPQKLPR